MKKKISGWSVIGWTVTLVASALLFRYGSQNMYFHQDGVDMLIDVVSNKFSSLVKPHAEHLIVGHRLLLYPQWLLFGIDYRGYLFVNIIIHLINLFLVFRITKLLTRSTLLASLAIIILSINTNWNETVLWMAGQPILLYTLFTLISILSIILFTKRQSKNKSGTLWYPLIYLLSLLPGLNHGIGLFWPMIPFAVYGWQKDGAPQTNIRRASQCHGQAGIPRQKTKSSTGLRRWSSWYWDKNRFTLTKLGVSLLLAQVSLLFIYAISVGSKISKEYQITSWFSSPLQIILFVIIGIGNTVVGRLVWPYENYRIRVPLVILSLIFGLAILKHVDWKKTLINKEFIFIVLVILGTYFTISLPRWQFGLAQTKAERYAYLTTMAIVVCLFIIFAQFNLKLRVKLLLFVASIALVIHQYYGFVWRATPWVKRPQRTRKLFTLLGNIDPKKCYVDEWLPSFVNPTPTRKYSALWPVLKKNFTPKFSQNAEDCIRLSELLGEKKAQAE